MSATCPFCPSELDEERVEDSNELCLFLASRDPILAGSGIIVPRAHRRDVFDLSRDEWAATFQLLASVKVTIDRELQEVLHAHMHVTPRFADEPLAGRGIRYWLKQDTNRRGSAEQ